MGISFSVKADVKEVTKALTGLQRKEIPAAVSASLNRAIPTTRTAIIREASRYFGVKQKLMRSRIRFQRRDRATKRFWEAGVFSVVSDIPAALTGKPRQLKKGATVGRRRYPGKFVATMPSGKTGIYGRLTRKRFPIKEEKIRIHERILPMIVRNLQTVGMPAFRKRLDHEMRYRLAKRGLA